MASIRFGLISAWLWLDLALLSGLDFALSLASPRIVKYSSLSEALRALEDFLGGPGTCYELLGLARTS